MPALLEVRTRDLAATGASPHDLGWQALLVVGCYAMVRNLFEAVCFLGGGHLTERLGDRGSLILFGLLTVGGYVLFLCVDHPVWTIFAALLILSWEPLSVPVTFTTVGATVKSNKHGMAFAIQSIQKRLPRLLGPAIAGLVIAGFQRRTGSVALGREQGMWILVAAALGLGLVSLLVQFRYMPHRPPLAARASYREIIATWSPELRRLLLAEVFTRWCDWLVREFVVLYVLIVCGIEDWFFGAVLVVVQHCTALVTYLPIGSLTAKHGLRPFIGLTLVFFALFPLCLVWLPWLLPVKWGLILAFVVYGLREIGEPARKAFITSSIPAGMRAQGVGLYWGIRSLALATAPLAGAAIWYAWGPTALMHAAFGFGCLGVAGWLTRRKGFDSPIA